jgi:tRNA(fMet)-specific endonuclease VapC
VNGNYLLDTNVLIYILTQKVPPQRSPIKGRLHISVITLGELHYGAQNSKWVAQNIARVNALTAQLMLVRCTKGTAEHYGVVKKKLLARARPISPNDMWIAATAIQHGLTLVTNDNDFKFVDGLLLEAW